MPEATAIKPQPKVEVQRPPEGIQGTPKIEQPKPIGLAEQGIADRIARDGNPDEVVRDIAKPPKFIRLFSKEQSTEERKQTAGEIRKQRKEYFGEKKTLAEQQTQTQEAINQKEPGLAEQRQRLEKLRDDIAELSGSGFTRLLNYVKLRGLNSDLETAQQAYDALDKETAVLREQQQEVDQQQESLRDAGKLEEGRQKIQNFYKQQKEKWANADYTKEDIARYFTEENLSSLSTEDYALLLKRFPSEMVTHVTRQGIRDHVGGDFHTAGLGEYFDNFRQIIQDGRLRSHFGTLFKDGLTKEAVARALELGQSITTREDAERMLAQFVSEGQGTGSYVDRTAFHAAAEEIADSIYGGERGNEVFFTFPSAHIAAEHYFSGFLGKIDQSTIGSNHNDQWIWSKDHEGLGINAGLVFIPADAKVDPKTGSKYELTSDKKPIERQDRIDTVIQYIDSERFEEISQEVNSVMGKFPTEQEVQTLRQKFNSEFGISDPKVQDALLDYYNNNDLTYSHNREKFQYEYEYEKEMYSPQNIAREVLLETGGLYKEAETTVSSKDFWEGYFTQHPEQQPKRVVYYEGGNPTEALRTWRETHGITKKAETADLGFSEKHVTTFEHPQVIAGMDRFKSIAEEVIADYFSQPKAT